MDNINGIDGTGGNAYYRTKDKKAPHNAYTSGAKLNKTIGQLGYRTSYSDTYTGHFQFAGGTGTYVPAESDAKDAYKMYPSYTMNNPGLSTMRVMENITASSTAENTTATADRSLSEMSSSSTWSGDIMPAPITSTSTSTKAERVMSLQAESAFRSPGKRMGTRTDPLS